MAEYYPIYIGDERFVAPVAHIESLYRLYDLGSEITAIHTHKGRIPLCELAHWLDRTGSGTRRVALLIRVPSGLVGVVVDRIEEPISADRTYDLPPLIHDASVDPTISGVILIEDQPCLVLDLEAYAIVNVAISTAQI